MSLRSLLFIHEIMDTWFFFFFAKVAFMSKDEQIFLPTFLLIIFAVCSPWMKSWPCPLKTRARQQWQSRWGGSAKPNMGHRDSLGFLKHLAAAAAAPPSRSRKSMYSSRRRRRLRSRQGKQLVVPTRPVEEEGEAAEGKAGTRRTSSCSLKPSTCSPLEPTPGKPWCVQK